MLWLSLGVLVATLHHTPGRPLSKKEAYIASKASDDGRGGPPAQAAFEPLYAKNLHTHEVMALEGPRVSPQAIDSFLRCWFTHEEQDISDALVGRMLTTAQEFGARKIHIVSGFRAEKYNTLLRKKGREVALRSHHTRGRALDFALPGVDVRKIYHRLLEVHQGGVGYYPRSGFVHIDTGRKRTWRGT